jgi:hypothetical protein
MARAERHPSPPCFRGAQKVTSGVLFPVLQVRELKLMVRAHTLTSDPSYERYLEKTESDRVQEGDRILVSLQEIGGQHRQSWLEACIVKAGHWVVIAKKGDISTEQTRALEQHGKLIGRVKPAHRKCLEKGWWKTGERKRVKGRYEHFVWERRELEQDNGAGAEEAEETDEGPAGKAEDIDSEKFWDPYQAPSTQSLKTFLRALPIGQYYDIQKVHGGNRWIAKTAAEEGRGRDDGSGGSVAPGSRHAQGEGKSPRRKMDQWDTKGGKGKSATEGRGAAKREQKGCGQLVKHKGGTGSDSSGSQDSAYRDGLDNPRKDFRPHPRRTKDYDIVREIVRRLDERGRHGARTTMVKVHGHTGEPLRMQCLMFVVKEGDNGRKAKGQWSPKVKTCIIREHEAEILWDRRSAGTWAEKFHSREGTGRRELGEAIQRCGDWAVTGWIRSLTPHCYLVARTYRRGG